MKTYKIFARPQGNYVAVKQGWSWPGFFFPFIWALVKQMWGLGIGLIVLFCVLGIVEASIEIAYGVEAAMVMGAMTTILGLFIAVKFGIEGNRWREMNLISRGFKYKGTVSEHNQRSAITSWMEGHWEGLESRKRI